jgi:hypothetical protein
VEASFFTLAGSFDRLGALAYGWVILLRFQHEVVMSTATALPTEVRTDERPEGERRAFPRYLILQRCFVRLSPCAQDVPRPEGWRCIAYNVSATGIGITLPLPVPLGSLLEIEAWQLPGARPLTARVVRTAPVEYLWFCGCELSQPLSEAELRIWIMGTRK